MSSFSPNETVYVIVPTAQVTQAMVNRMRTSFNIDEDKIRKSVDDSLTLLTVKTDQIDLFEDYQLYNQNEILPIIETSEWQVEP